MSARKVEITLAVEGWADALLDPLAVAFSAHEFAAASGLEPDYDSVEFGVRYVD